MWQITGVESRETYEHYDAKRETCAIYWPKYTTFRTTNVYHSKRHFFRQRPHHAFFGGVLEGYIAILTHEEGELCAD